MEKKHITFAKNAVEAVEKSGFVIGETMTCKEIVVTSERSGKFCVTAKFSEVPIASSAMLLQNIQDCLTDQDLVD